MTSKSKARMASHHPVNNATIHTPRSDPLAKLKIDGKLFKKSSNRSAKSSSTDATTLEKCVRFEKRHRSRKTLSIKDYTPDEVRATWYTSEDVLRRSRKYRKEIRKMNEGGKLKDKKYCSRGLEGHTHAGFDLKKRARIFSINAVLDEQLAQWDEGVFDEDAIAAIYIRGSSSCQMWANFVGQQDQKAIHGSPSSASRRSTASAAA